MHGTLTLPHPIHQATYFSLVGPMSLSSVSRPRVAGGGQAGLGVRGRAGGGGAGAAGGGEARVKYTGQGP